MVHVVFLHPDLGIGGAERSVLDAGLALKSKGHNVKFVTAHHDVGHSFEETKNGTFEVGLTASVITVHQHSYLCSSGSRNFRDGGTRNMKYKLLHSAAIFFVTIFLQESPHPLLLC